MNKFNLQRGIILFVVCSFFVLESEGQQIKLDADSVFFSARTLALNKKYSTAREKCYELLNDFPDYYDARVLIGRTYAWEHQYDSARSEINKVLIKANYFDAINAMIDVENWSGDKSKALFYCDMGQRYYPANETFGLKKARLLIQTNEINLAQREILHTLELNPANKEARELLREVKNARILNKISVQYSLESYNEPWIRRWNLMNIEYSRQTRLGAVAARMYLGDVVLDGESLFEKNTATQYELEAYPIISGKNYAYLNYGYSSGDLFPEHRVGAELYQKLLNTFEISAGLRYLQFRTTENLKNDVLIYTGTVGKYFQNYWFSFRPYLNSGSDGLSQSYYFTVRRYLSIKDNFVSLELGSGSSPDDPLDYSVNYDSFKLNMKKIQLSWHQLVCNRWIIYIIGAYQNEEYSAGLSRNVYSAKLQLGYHF